MTVGEWQLCLGTRRSPATSRQLPNSLDQLCARDAQDFCDIEASLDEDPTGPMLYRYKRASGKTREKRKLFLCQPLFDPQRLNP